MQCGLCEREGREKGSPGCQAEVTQGMKTSEYRSKRLGAARQCSALNRAMRACASRTIGCSSGSAFFQRSVSFR
jgi:hypothetical protein